MLRAFVDRPQVQASPARREETIGAVSRYTWDWAPFELAEGVTVDAVTWASSNTGCVSISGAALASSVSTAYLTAANEGQTIITLTASTDGTQQAVRQFIVRVVDPSVVDSGNPW